MTTHYSIEKIYKLLMSDKWEEKSTSYDEQCEYLKNCTFHEKNK